MRAFTLIVGIVVTSLLARWELGGSTHVHKQPAGHSTGPAAALARSARPHAILPQNVRAAARRGGANVLR